RADDDRLSAHRPGKCFVYMTCGIQALPHLFTGNREQYMEVERRIPCHAPECHFFFVEAAVVIVTGKLYRIVRWIISLEKDLTAQLMTPCTPGYLGQQLECLFIRPEIR